MELSIVEHVRENVILRESVFTTTPTAVWSTKPPFELRRHSCLLRAATSASSQVSPIPRRSFLTIGLPLQFVLGRPGPLLKPGTSQYSA